MAERGAPAALRGYRLQALYTLDRVLRAPEGTIFRLEGKEDLDVLTEDGEVLEVIQVKAVDGPLTLSKLEPEKGEAFFRRVLKRRASFPRVAEHLVSFSAFGSTMTEAWNRQAAAYQNEIAQLQRWGYTQGEAEQIIDTVRLVREDADEVEERVLGSLRHSSMLAGELEVTRDILIAWLLRAAEGRHRITRADLRQRIDRIGQFLHERRAHHAEWFTSLIPLDESNLAGLLDPKQLAEQFEQGEAARYDHIVARVDIVRPERLQEIHRKFQEARLVFIHGASGQGKSTLAYRYLQDYVPAGCRLEVREIESARHALSVARAIHGHLRLLDVCAYVYIDVNPRDSAWISLVRELAGLSQIRVLVTIREEDWQRTKKGLLAALRWEEISLDFDEREARALYDKLASMKQPGHLLDFGNAWSRFRRQGPLLEFTYLVVQHETLETRLREQVTMLEDEVRERKLDPAELTLLYWVSVASAYGARLDMNATARALALPAARRTVERFQREYLLRVGEQESVIEGLHPIRSKFLVQLLEDSTRPWYAAAAGALGVMHEADLEIFLLHAFARRYQDYTALLAALSRFQARTWKGLAGVMNALLWFGVRQYIGRNEQLIREVARSLGTGWYGWLMTDVGNVGAFSSDIGRVLSELPASLAQDDSQRQIVNGFRQRLTSRASVLRHAREWLGTQRQPESVFDGISDWQGIAQVGFWVRQLGVGHELLPTLGSETLAKALHELPLDIAADVTFGLWLSENAELRKSLVSMQERLLERFQQETKTPAIEDDGCKILAHFLLDEDWFIDQKAKDGGTPEEPNIRKPSIHREAIYRVELLRRIMPNREVFGCRGYGIGLFRHDLPYDESHKEIPSSTLLPHWPVELNARFIRLGTNLLRLESWQQYALEVVAARQQNIAMLKQLENALEAYFRTSKPIALDGERVDAGAWNAATLRLKNLQLLPRCAVDEWGFTSEGNPDQGAGLSHGAISNEVSRAISLERYQDYCGALSGFVSRLGHFYLNARRPLQVLPELTRGRDMRERARIQALMDKSGTRLDTGALTTYQLALVLESLPVLQREFRRHFARFFSTEKLELLDREEQEQLRRSMTIWHRFLEAREPIRGKRDRHHSVSEFRVELDQIRRRLEKGFHRLKEAHDLAVAIHSEEVQCEHRPALWLTFSIDDPIRMYEAADSVYQALCQALPRRHDAAPNLPFCVASSAWHTVQVIPLVQGRALDKYAFCFSTTLLLWVWLHWNGVNRSSCDHLTSLSEGRGAGNGLGGLPCA